MDSTRKKLYVLGIILLMGGILAVTYPLGSRIVLTLARHTYAYAYTHPRSLAVADTSSLPPAQAVPILLYHGVIVGDSPLGTNTERNVFIQQMEALKSAGYQTITIEQFDQFRQGKFTLPPKPIIITFDDGRKDSYYPVDQVFKDLGFTGTIFVATIKADTNDLFYLSWDELKQAENSGRFDIEAHGRQSHEKIPADVQGTLGGFLSSRIVNPKTGAEESVADYERRVEADYQAGIADIQNHLGKTPLYFAIPLNTFGEIVGNNYTGAIAFNREMTAKYFKLAFSQALHYDGQAFESFYNYKDTDPMQLKRLEVENMSPQALIAALDKFAPTQPGLSYNGTQSNLPVLLSHTQVLYGNLATSSGFRLSSDSTLTVARAILGDTEWSNYQVNATISREQGRSVSLLLYYQDENNYIDCTWGEQSLTVKEHVDGNVQVLGSYYPWQSGGDATFAATVAQSKLTARVGNVTVVQRMPIVLTRGAAGLSVWDPGSASAFLKNLQITSVTPPVPPVQTTAAKKDVTPQSITSIRF